MFNVIRKISAAILLTSAPIVASAQAKIVLDSPVAHVGEVVFQTPKQVVFGFKNKGKQALEIIDVKPMCGCTKVDWTRGAIEPGQKGQVTVEYDALTMGSFRKEVALYTTAQQEPIYLQMEGRVVATKLDYTGDFPIDLGGIRVNTNYLEFDDVNRGDHPVAELQIFNQERTPYRPTLMHLPAYLTVQSVPEVIAGGRTGKVRVTLDSEKLALLGLNQTRIYLARFLGDKVSEKNEILVSSVLLPDFSKLTADELARAPKMVLSAENLYFALNGKKKVTQTVTVTNAGKETLSIRSVQVFNQALSVSLADRTIAPGKSTEMKITVSARYLKKAKNLPRVLLITNDPSGAKRTVNVQVEEQDLKIKTDGRKPVKKNAHTFFKAHY